MKIMTCSEENRGLFVTHGLYTFLPEPTFLNETLFLTCPQYLPTDAADSPKSEYKR